jgi:hypothetical protein
LGDYELAFNGSGTFNREYNWVTDRNDGLTIQASRMDGEADSFATALSLCMLKDGQQTPTANIGWGGFKLTSLGDATNATDALNRQTGDARYPLKVGTTTDNAIARYDGVAGQLQDSLVIIDDTTGHTHPATHDTGALGTDALRWSDLWLAFGAVITWGTASVADVALTHSLNSLAFTGASAGYSFDAAVTVPNTGLRILDTNASHGLTVKPGSDITAERTLTLTTGDADRTVTLAGDLTTAGAFVTAGAFGLTLTTTALTDVTLPTTGTLATLAGAETLSSKILTAPDINAGTADSLTSLSIRTTGSAHDVSIGVTEVLTANRALTLKLNDAARTVDLGGNLTLGGALTTAAAFITSGANSLTLTTTGATNVTLPTTGTLAILGANTFTATQTIESTDGGATAGPILDLYRNSATPAAADFLGKVKFSGEDSGGNTEEYANITGQIVDPTGGSEDCAILFQTDVAGTLATRFAMAQGLWSANATGGDKGVDTINALSYYGELVGTTTNDDATAGRLGEYVSSVLGAGSAVALTTATPANVTSISLTAGDWDVWGAVVHNPAATTTITILHAAINTTSATLPTVGLDTRGYTLFRCASFAPAAPMAYPVPVSRVSLGATTTIYLVAQATFATSTMSAYGFIAARRVR